jgi:hypothetical protein
MHRVRRCAHRIDVLRKLDHVSPRFYRRVADDLTEDTADENFTASGDLIQTPQRSQVWHRC